MYSQIYSIENLQKAFYKARKGKTKRRYVKRFQKDLPKKLEGLSKELENQTYSPCPRKSFILRDPKTRRITKSAFRDRVVHHALCNFIIPILEKSFIYDSHANQIGKGTTKAIERFDKFKGKVSKNNTRDCYVLKADIKQYFVKVNHEILLGIIKRKITCTQTLWLIRIILENAGEGGAKSYGRGMPLGNLTSQFFANLYLNELDQFVKHKLKAKYYIRYVDDFVFLHESKEQLKKWKIEINNFLKEKLKLELHPSKTHILNLNSGINFLGFRIFCHHRLIRKSNLKNFERKFNKLRILFDEETIGRGDALQSLEGWLAYCSHANTYKYRGDLIKRFSKYFSHGQKLLVHNKKNYTNYVRKLKESELKFSNQKTLYYLRKGLSIRDIALKQNIKKSTVWEHIANLIGYRQLSVWEILPKEKIHKILNKIYSHKERLRDIKGRLKNQDITYDEIACVVASIKSKMGKSPVTE